MDETYQELFEEFSLRSGIRLKNRMVMAPMTTSSSNEDGTVSDAEIDYYARRAGGVGMLITACIYVSGNGKGFRGQFDGSRDEMIPSMRRLAEAIKKRGAKAVLQIYHGGRMCPANAVPGGDVVSASAVASERKGGVVPRALENAEIEAIIRDYGATTRRAIEAGYDGVELHGANGYLIQQFFSPHSNRREDRWGGDLRRRMSFPLAVVDEVKRVVAAHATYPFLVGYRFSPEEEETPGITMEDTLELVDVLADKELDYLHVSLTDFWSVPRRGAGDSKSRIQWIRERIAGRTPLIGVGSIYTADDALRALQSGVPLIGLGREIIMEPDWVEKVAAGKEREIATTLSRADQQRLVVPDPLWRSITARPGWFPVV